MTGLPQFSPDGGLSLDFPLADGLVTSRLALGCMMFGEIWDSPSVSSGDRSRARAALETALELGWNFFDHADIYCNGNSERVFGELVRELNLDRESIIIQGKCGIRFKGEPHPDSPKRFDYSREHIIASVDGILARLGMDYLDSLLLHRPDFLAEPEEIIAAFDQLRGMGKVRHFGVSNFTPHLLGLYRAAGFIPVANQVEVNLLRTALIDCSMIESGRKPLPGHPGDGTLEWNRSHGVVTQAWAPMAYGYLCGREPDWEPERVARLSAEVARIARLHDAPAEAVVIGWLLRHPAMIQPVIGTRDPDRLRACHQALKLNLSREEWYSLYSCSRGNELP
ncbi:MAG: aldo/keto reductase [Opitutales bacterium]|jgi:predicted oxidoreductase